MAEDRQGDGDGGMRGNQAAGLEQRKMESAAAARNVQWVFLSKPVMFDCLLLLSRGGLWFYTFCYCRTRLLFTP